MSARLAVQEQYVNHTHTHPTVPALFDRLCLLYQSRLQQMLSTICNRHCAVPRAVSSSDTPLFRPPLSFTRPSCTTLCCGAHRAYTRDNERRHASSGTSAKELFSVRTTKRLPFVRGPPLTRSVGPCVQRVFLASLTSTHNYSGQRPIRVEAFQMTHAHSVATWVRPSAHCDCDR